MDGSDVFAVITTHDQKNKADTALKLKHNSRWFCKATEGVALKPIMNSRETTPAEDSQSDDEKEASIVDRLVVSFSKLLALNNLENELQLSTDPILSPILLRHRGTKGISGMQISSTAILPDLCSTQSLVQYYCE